MELFQGVNYFRRPLGLVVAWARSQRFFSSVPWALRKTWLQQNRHQNPEQTRKAHVVQRGHYNFAN